MKIIALQKQDEPLLCKQETALGKEEVSSEETMQYKKNRVEEDL